MTRKIAAVVGGVVLGVAIAFARAGAFPFWNSEEKPQAKPELAPPVQQSQAQTSAPAPAPANQPEPNERGPVVSSFAPLVKRVMPTVVNVAVVEDVKTFGMSPFGGEGGEGGGGEGGGEGGQPSPMVPGDPFEQFRHFFGEIPREYKQHGLGSGVIISPDGYILTNNHVVGGADEIHVTLMDKREFTAKVIGKDPKTDLALIKIDTKEPLPAADLGDSGRTEVGDWVIAIGNPFGFSLTVTAGIVSAKGRILGGKYDDFIQTDASINPGNSGGPLFNADGQVVGINSVIYTRTGANNGIGFAIPIDLAKSVMEQLKEHGRVVRGYLGVEIQEVTADLAQSFGLEKAEGALVANVEKDGPAAKAGLQRGDVIVKFNDRVVHDQHELPAIVAETPIGKSVDVEVVRDGKHKTVQVTIGELKEPEIASAKGEEPGSDWGIQVTGITPEIAKRYNLQSDKGVVITGVRPDTPAAEAALQPGDLVLEVNHEKIGSVEDFVGKAKESKKSHKSALLLVQRGNASLYTVIKPQG
jgi:serine protease Do